MSRLERIAVWVAILALFGIVAYLDGVNANQKKAIKAVVEYTVELDNRQTYVRVRKECEDVDAFFDEMRSHIRITEAE